MMSAPFGSKAGASLSASSNLVETLLSSTLLEAIPDATVAANQEGIIVQVNSQTEELFGYTRAELIGQKIEILVPERHRPQHHHHREDFVAQPRIRRMGAGLELHGRRRDGSEFPVEISLSPVHTANGVIVLSAIRDITDRKRIEEQLRKANEELNRRTNRQLWEYQNRLALTVDSSQDAIIGKNLDGIVTSWNKSAERIYGYTAEEMIGKSISILAPTEQPDEIPHILAKIRRGERVDYFETIRVAKDGRRLNVSVSISPVCDAEGQIIGASAIARDITAQKRSEDALRQAQKMEAVGRLAGGVAHDFNNILGIVTACSELMRTHIDPQHPAWSYVDNIKKASDRGAALVRQLLSFSRRQPIQARVLDLNERIKEVSKLVRPLLGDDVHLTFQPRSDSAIVEVDPGQLDQIVVNLAVNARDAMPKGGKLVLETAVQDFDAGFADLHPPLTAGRYAMLAVSDNGSGMDQATVSRIFEPFFTTKELGKGTGLGLATVYGIVKQSGGHIWVYSEPGLGTTFKIYLPSAEHKLGTQHEADSDALPPRGEGKTILVVEDDPLMRTLTRQMLAGHGYSVLEAEDGKTALQFFDTDYPNVDLTLTDVVMQGMGGPELALRLMEIRPEMRVVYMSGYTGELIKAHDSLNLAFLLLEKPFTRSTLLKTIHSAMQ